MRFVTMPERTRILALRADGLSFRAISGIVGLPQETCRRHCKAVTRGNEPSPSSVDRAMRIERLFASCNRALAEARA